MGLIEIGQDALGAWAWMLRAGDRMIESGSRLSSSDAAIEAAMDAWISARIRGEPGIPSSPLVIFPDGEPD